MNLTKYLEDLLAKIVWENQYGSPDLGNDEGIPEAIKYFRHKFGENCDLYEIHKLLEESRS